MSAPRAVLVATLVVASVVTAGLVTGSVGAPTAADAVQNQREAGPTEISQCTVIDEPGRYVLTEDITTTSESACIDIAASDVVLNGNGHEVAADEESPFQELILSVGTSNGTLENVTVTNATFAKERAYGNPAVRLMNVSDATLSDVTVENGRYGVAIWNAHDVTISDFKVDGYQTNGAFDTIAGVKVANSNGVTIIDGRIDRVRAGVSLGDDARGSGDEETTGGNHTVEDLRIGTSASTTYGGVVVTTTNNVIRNVTHLGGFGPQILIAGNASGNRIVESSITEKVVVNTTGSADKPNRIARNTFMTDDDIGAIGIEVRRNAVPLDVRANVFEGLDRPVLVDPPTNNTTAATTVDVHRNVFRGGNFGVRNNDPDDIVDARANYWGAANGPSSKTVRGPPGFEDPDAPFADPVTGELADGDGVGVSESAEPGVSNVHFDPYLKTVPAAGIDAEPGAIGGEPNGTAPSGDLIKPPEPEPPAEPEVNGTAVTECQVIDEPGRYVLTKDISEEGTCLQIAASDVVLDGNGHSANGMHAGEAFIVGAVNVSAEHPLPSDETIRNVTVEDVTLDKSTVAGGRNVIVVNASDVRFQNVTIRDGSTGVYVRNSTDVRVADFEAIGHQPEASAAAARIAVHAKDSRNVTVRNGRTEGFYRGIELEGGGNHTVENMTVVPSPLPTDRQRIGVTLSTADSVVRDVEVADPEHTDAFAVLERNASGNELVDNRVNTTVVVETNGAATEPNVVANNTFVGAGRGVHVRMNTVPLVVESNVFENERSAVRVEPPVSCAFGPEGAETVEIHRNVFRNGKFGVYNNDAAEVVDARANYWGTESGPSSPDDPDAPFVDPVTDEPADGDGRAVTEGAEAGVSNVRFDPYLDEPPAEVGDDEDDE